MTDKFELLGADADLLMRIVEGADQILVKKLSNNDREWAKPKRTADGKIVPGKWMNNQAGAYIPREQRDSGFFPPLELKLRSEAEADEIWERYVVTKWPQVDDEDWRSRLVHYTSKGPETHFTGLPKPAFVDLLPASFLIIARVPADNGHVYECMTIDSGSDVALLLAELFDLRPDFLVGVFEPTVLRAVERDKVLDFADQVIAAWLGGKIDDFAKTQATMPSTINLARMAREVFLRESGLAKIDPFALDNPGDVLRQISLSIEWDLFREYQRRERSVELVRLLLGDSARAYSAANLIRRLIDELPGIDALMLSASQQRKSRAGYSYEHHIEAMLHDGAIPFEKQVIVEAKKRPDFILPSLAWIDGLHVGASSGLILSAKTTLRERWKQVEREKGGRQLFLTTVDENIAGNAIEDMASFGVQLVIPESLRKSKLAEYERHRNVLGFREFCELHVKPHLASWKTAR